MPLIKKRPKIGLMAPTVVRPGKEFEVEVILDVERELPTDAISVEFRGGTTGGTSDHRWGQVICRQVATLSDAVVLPAGTHRRRVRFRPPVDLPSTYKGRFADVEFVVEVHVEIPWWPDKKVRFPLRVQALNDPVDEAGSRVFVPTLEGAQRGEAHFELSLGTQIIEPGGNLHGALAVANAHAKHYRGFEVELVVTESEMRYGSVYSYPLRRWVVNADPRLAESGATVPFKLTMPTELCPAFRTGTLRVEWSLVVRLKVAWGRDRTVRLPMQVRVADSARPGDLLPVPVAVGDARATATWREAARLAHWEFGPGGTLSREISGYSVQVSRRDEGEQRALVRLTFGDLALDLGWLPGKGRGFRCADPAPSMHLWKEMGAALEGLEVVDACDTHLVFAGGGAALELADISRLLGQAEEAVEKIVDVLASLPPASNWAEHAEALESLAGALGGRTQPAACRVAGSYGGVPFDVRLRGDCWSLRAEVEPPFTRRERVDANVSYGSIEPRPEYEEWFGQLLVYRREGHALYIELQAGEGLPSFPIELAIRLLDPLAKRRQSSLGGYR